MFRSEKSKFRVSKVDAGTKGFGSFVDENTLLLNSPESIKDYDDLTYLGRQAVMKSAFSKSLSELKTPFNDYLKGKKAVHYTDNNFVRWRSYGDPDMRHRFLEKVSPQTYMGLGKVPFEIKVTFDGHLPGSLIMPLVDKSIKMRTLDYGRKVGGGTIYTVELITDNESLYLEDTAIRQGLFYLSVGGAYGEASKDMSNLEFGRDVAYSEYEVPLITGAWEYKVTNLAHERYKTLMIGETKMVNGKEHFLKGGTKIAGFLEMEGYAQIEWMTELWDFYGSASTTLVDRSSYKELTTSPGATEFLDQGNVFRYNPAYDGIDFLANKVDTLWYDKVDPSEQSVGFFGGKGFIKWFHESVLAKYGQEAVLGTYDFVLGNSTSFHNDPQVKGYSYTSYQFTQYDIQPWGIVTVAHFPILDNTKINVVKAPNGIYTATSYEGIAFNIKFGDTNVRKLIRNNSEHSGYVCGHWTPLGAAGAGNPMKPSHQGRFYSWGYGRSWGLQIENVESSMWVKPVFG